MTETTTDIREIPFLAADGSTRTLADYADKVLLIVNVASRCGLTPQYAQLEELQKRYADRGFTVLGFPCNQFEGQEPGSIAEILDYCATTWGVTFPIFDKVEVNGEGATALYRALRTVQDGHGEAGVVGWNFEKFVVTPAGDVHRFRSKIKPDDPSIVELIEANLPE